MDIKVNFKIDVDDFISYEFETIGEDIYIEEGDFDCRLFRVFIYKDKDKLIEIYVANSEDYDIHEEVTYLFDVKDIIVKCEQEDNKGNVTDATEAFKRDIFERYGTKY